MAEVVEKRNFFNAVARRVLSNENAIRVIILVALIAVMAIITKGLILSRNNVRNILLQSSSRGIASLGQTVVILAGGFDISVGGTALLGATLGASLLTPIEYLNIAGGPIPLGAGILVMLALGLAVGAFNGFFIARLGVNTVIITLAMWMMTTGIAYRICVGKALYDLPSSLAFIGQGYIAGVPVAVIVFGGVAVAIYFALYHTTWGRSVYAVGGNPISAWLSGINVPNVKFTTFVLCGFLAVVAAIVTMSRSLSVSMVSNSGLEIDTIAACFIGGISMGGGRGTVIGAVLGVIILGVINNGMNVIGVDATFQDLAKGAIIVAAVTIDVMRSRRG